MHTTGAELQNLLNEVSKALRLRENGAAEFNLLFCSRRFCCPELYLYVLNLFYMSLELMVNGFWI